MVNQVIQTNSPTEKQLENLNVFLLFYKILFFLQIQKDPKGHALIAVEGLLSF